MSTIDKKSAEVSEDKYSCLRLENQLCFPLYVCSKEVIRKYKPFLDKLDLTYTQYIAMMVLWDRRETNVKEMGECLFLDSGTLTPLLKKLEQKGYIERHRSKEDERNLMITITDEGMKLREEAVKIPAAIGSCISLDPEDGAALYKLLYKVLHATSESEEQ